MNFAVAPAHRLGFIMSALVAKTKAYLSAGGHVDTNGEGKKTRRRRDGLASSSGLNPARPVPPHLQHVTGCQLVQRTAKDAAADFAPLAANQVAATAPRHTGIAPHWNIGRGQTILSP